MNITYTDTLHDVTEAQLMGFFGAWHQAPSPGVHLRLLAGSAARILAVEAGSGQVVGYLSVALDAQGQAYVPMLEVLPAYKGQGVAGELTRRMMVKLSPQLACAPKTDLGYRRQVRLEHRTGA